MKILIIRLSSIGDILLTTPFVRCCRNAFPEAEIHFLTFEKNKDLLIENPYLNKVVYFKNSIWETYISLKNEKYDVCFDLHNNLRSIGLRVFLGVKSYVLNKQNYKKTRLVWSKDKSYKVSHIVQRYLETGAKVGIKDDAKGLDFFFPKNFESPILPTSHEKKYIVIVAGALQNTKQLPFEKLEELCAKINLPIVLLGGEKERERGQLIEDKFKNKVYNVCGKISLYDSAFYLQNAFLVITPDTGMMHLASAFQKTIFTIWGNTIPEFGMHAYLPKSDSKEFEIDNLSCRPCSRIGFEECPKGHFDCMQKQDMEKISQIINSL